MNHLDENDFKFFELLKAVSAMKWIGDGKFEVPTRKEVTDAGANIAAALGQIYGEKYDYWIGPRPPKDNNVATARKALLTMPRQEGVMWCHWRTRKSPVAASFGPRFG